MSAEVSLLKENIEEKQVSINSVAACLLESLLALDKKKPNRPPSSLVGDKGERMKKVLVDLFEIANKGKCITENLEIIRDMHLELDKNNPKEQSIFLASNNALRSNYYNKVSPEHHCHFSRLLKPALMLNDKDIACHSQLLWHKWYALLHKSQILFARDHNFSEAYKIIKKCWEYYAQWKKLAEEEENGLDKQDVKAEYIKIEIVEACILAEFGKKNHSLYLFNKIFSAKKIQNYEWIDSYLHFLEIFGAENEIIAKNLEQFLQNLEMNNLENKYVELFYKIYSPSDTFAKLMISNLEVINLKWKFATYSYDNEKTKLIQKWEERYENDPQLFYEEGVAKIFEQEGDLHKSNKRSFEAYYDAIEHYENGGDIMKYHIYIIHIKNIAKNYEWISQNFHSIKNQYLNILGDSASDYIKNTFFDSWIALQDIHEKSLMNYIDVFQSTSSEMYLDQSLATREKLKIILKELCKIYAHKEICDPIVQDVFYILMCIYELSEKFDTKSLKRKFEKELKRYVNKKTMSDIKNQSDYYSLAEPKVFFRNLKENFQIDNAAIINNNGEWQESSIQDKELLLFLKENNGFSQIIQKVIKTGEVQILKNYSDDHGPIISQLIIIPFHLLDNIGFSNVLIAFRDNNNLPLSALEITILKENFSLESIANETGNAMELLDYLVVKNLEKNHFLRSEKGFQKADNLFNEVFQKDYGANRRITVNDCITLTLFDKPIAVAAIEPLSSEKNLINLCLDYDGNKNTHKNKKHLEAQIAIKNSHGKIVELTKFTVAERFRLRGSVSRELLRYALNCIREYKINNKPLDYFVAVANKIMLQIAKDIKIPIEYESGEIDIFNKEFKQRLLNKLCFDEQTADQFIGSYAKRFPPHILLIRVSDLDKMPKI